MKYPRLVLAALVSAFPLLCLAEDVIHDDFESTALSEEWTKVKGTWTISDGRLKGAELASDDHAAVLFYKAPHANTKGSMKFQLNGSEGFHLSFNHAKGHLFRILVSEREAVIRTDKNKKDPASKPINLAKAKGSFEQGKTYMMNFEVSDETVKVDFDNGVALEGSHELIKKGKTGYRFIIKGEGVLFDDFVIHSQN